MVILMYNIIIVVLIIIKVYILYDIVSTLFIIGIIVDDNWNSYHGILSKISADLTRFNKK